MTETICYSGLGANKNGMHSEKEFRDLIKSQKLCKYECPKSFKGWMKWFGANKISESKCKNSMKMNSKIHDRNKNVDEALDNLKNCINNQCDHGKENPLYYSLCSFKNCLKEGSKYSRAYKSADIAIETANRMWKNKD